METLKYEFESKHFCFADCSREDFATTTLPCRFGPKILWLFKLFAVLYWSLSISLFLVYQGVNGWHYLSNWGVFMILVYFISSFIVVSYEVFRKKSEFKKNGEGDLLLNHVDSSTQDRLRWYHKMTWVLQTLALDGSIVITIIFWTMSKFQFSFLLFNKHAMSTIFMLIDFWLVRVPVRLLHVVYVIAVALSYSLFTLILYLVGYISKIYPFMDWSWHPAVAAAVCILLSTVGCTVVHSLVFLMYKLRNYLTTK